MDVSEASMGLLSLGIVVMVLGALIGNEDIILVGTFLLLVSVIIFSGFVLSTSIAGAVAQFLPIIVVLGTIAIVYVGTVGSTGEGAEFLAPISLLFLVLLMLVFLSQGGGLPFLKQLGPLIMVILILGWYSGITIWGDPTRGLLWATAGTLILMLAVWEFAVKDVLARKPFTGEVESLIGKKGHALDVLKPGGFGKVQMAGAIWRAENIGSLKVSKGEDVRAINVEKEDLLLQVAKET